MMRGCCFYIENNSSGVAVLMMLVGESSRRIGMPFNAIFLSVFPQSTGQDRQPGKVSLFCPTVLKASEE